MRGHMGTVILKSRRPLRTSNYVLGFGNPRLYRFSVFVLSISVEFLVF